VALAGRVLQPHLNSDAQHSYGHTITLDLPFQDAIAMVKDDAFRPQGFGGRGPGGTPRTLGGFRHSSVDGVASAVGDGPVQLAAC
jgi:hypothetical protein